MCLQDRKKEDISFGEAEKECQAMKVVSTVQSSLMKEVELGTWAEVEAELPHYANMDLSKLKLQKGKPLPKNFKVCQFFNAAVV